ncbi:MAG: glycoside hydrolase family 99-like domain-containing protein [Betaproteobacteria bacterium]
MNAPLEAEPNHGTRVVAFFRFTVAAMNESAGSPKNDLDWARVRNASPNFVDHYQPHIPRELGYYDTGDLVVREAQEHLARQHGISAFCYLCRWDERTSQLVPKRQIVAPDGSEFPFCVCWENGSVDPVAEDAGDAPQRRIFSVRTSAAFLQELIPLMREERYFRIDGRPLVIVARPEAIAETVSVLRMWRDECERADVGNPYLVCFGTAWGSNALGFDAAVEFPPAGFFPESYLSRVSLTNRAFKGEVRGYRSSLAQSLAALRPAHKLFQTVMPAWDETACNQDSAMTFVGSTPELFAQWTERAIQRTWLRFAGEERVVFIRSWNEWNLGCHLEPDLRYGRQYLEAFRSAMQTARAVPPERPTWSALRRSNGTSAGAASRIVRSSFDPSGAGSRVSVVMPAYNHERYVIPALDSVVTQSHDNLEVIVVDDGSTDSTGALLDEYAVRCKSRRITVVHQQNAGAHEALNHGLSLAAGEYLALINSDDLYAAHRLELMLAEMKADEAAFAFSNTCFIDEDGGEIGDEDYYVAELRAAIASGTGAPDPLYGFIVTNIAISTGNFVFRQNLLHEIGGFCAMRICHDWDFVMAASYRTPLLFIDEPLYLYRLHRANTFSSRRLLGCLEIEQLQSRFFADIGSHPLLKEARSARRFFAHARARGLGGFLPYNISTRSRAKG